MGSGEMPIGEAKRAKVASGVPSACAHCGRPVPAEATASGYCCAGCEAVAALLRAEDLTRYYAIAGGDVLPVGARPAARSHAWLEPLVEAQGGAEIPTVELDVQGIHCAACVWLMNETFRRRPGGVSLTVNPALGQGPPLLAARGVRARGLARGGRALRLSVRAEPQARVGRRLQPDLAARHLGRAGHERHAVLDQLLLRPDPGGGGALSRCSRASPSFCRPRWSPSAAWPFFRSAVRGLRAGGSSTSICPSRSASRWSTARRWSRSRAGGVSSPAICSWTPSTSSSP